MTRLAAPLSALAALALIGTSAAAQAPTKPKAPAKPAAKPQVVIETSKGTIVAELEPAVAPKSVANFLAYADSGFYEGLIFHRVISGFMIQGGGFTPDFKPRQVKAPIPLEAGKGLSNKRGTLAMARTAVPDSATSQFFINLVDNDRLDSYGGGYAVFGKVLKGMEVVDAIAKVTTKPQGGHQNAPVEAVLIKKIRVKR